MAIGLTNRAALNDAKSVALTLRARAGHRTRDISKSKCLFVTHNVALVESGNRFLVEHGQLARLYIGVLTSITQITTVAWLANEVIYEPQRISKELIANCYKAGLPGEGWDEQFWATLSNTNREDITNLLQSSMFVHAAREIALQQSFGHTQLLIKLNFSEVAANAEKRAEEESNAKLALGHTTGQLKERESQIARQEGIARGIADRSSKWILAGVTALSVLITIWSEWNSQDGGYAKAALQFALVVVAILSAVDLFFADIKVGLQRQIARGIYNAIRYVQGKIGGL